MKEFNQIIGNLKRVNIVGCSGSGKTTFSRKLSAILKIPYYEMDAIFWKAKWEESSDEEFFPKIKKITTGERWVLDGNYSRTNDIKWTGVDCIIWLDFSLARTVFQALKRATLRSLSGKELWAGTGNCETFHKAFFSKESMILYTMKNYRKVRNRYLKLMKSQEESKLMILRIQSPHEAKKFLFDVQKSIRS